MIQSLQNNRRESTRVDAPRSVGASRFSDTRRFSRTAAHALYERELAYYLADAPFLPVEKCAERCVKLSMLLAQAQLG